MKKLPGLYEGKEVKVRVGEDSRYFGVHVVELTDRDIGFEVPLEREGRPVRVRPGLKVSVEYSTQTGIYRFGGVVTEVGEDGTAWFRMNRPSKWDHLQRRRFFRLSISVAVWWRPVRGEEGGVGRFREALTHDLSGGGLRLAFEEDLPVGTELQLKIDIGEHRPVEATGKVVRSCYREDDGVVLASIEFLEIDEVDRDRLIRYLFQRQGELRRKGLL